MLVSAWRKRKLARLRIAGPWCFPWILRTWCSGRLDVVEEGCDLAAEVGGVARQLLRRAQHLGRRRPGLAGALVHVRNAAGHLFGAARRLLHVARNLGRGRALL